MKTIEKIQSFLDHPCECKEDVEELRFLLTDERFIGDLKWFSDQDRADLWGQVNGR